MTDDGDLRAVFLEAASEVPDPWELGGVTYHGPEAVSLWVAFLFNRDTGLTGGPEGTGDTAVGALNDLRTRLSELR